MTNLYPETDQPDPDPEPEFEFEPVPESETTPPTEIDRPEIHNPDFETACPVCGATYQTASGPIDARAESSLDSTEIVQICYSYSPSEETPSTDADGHSQTDELRQYLHTRSDMMTNYHDYDPAPYGWIE